MSTLPVDLPSEPALILKILILGDSGVGKSNLLSRFCDDKYDENKKATIGLDIYNYSGNSNGQRVQVNFWDTAGQEKYRSISTTFYKDALGIILTFDITNRNSFTNLDIWFHEIKNYGHKDVKILLIGNKIDLSEKRRVTTEEADKFAREHNTFYMETSAKSNSDRCVDQAFQKIIDLITLELEKPNKKREVEKYVSVSKYARESVIGSNGQKKGCCG